MSVAIGLWLGIKTESYVGTEEYPPAPSYAPKYATQVPAAIDREQTYNASNRQAVLTAFNEARTEHRRKQRLLAQHKAQVVVSRSAESVINEYYYEVTAYTANVESTGKQPGDVGYGITASGHLVQTGITAACPQSLAFGTRLHIEGVGYRVCHDRGGAITEGRLDVYMADLGQAQAFGRQTLKVRVLR